MLTNHCIHLAHIFFHLIFACIVCDPSEKKINKMLLMNKSHASHIQFTT